MFERLEKMAKELMPAVDFCSFRFVRKTSEQLAARQGVPLPPTIFDDAGVMVTVLHGGGIGYGATSDLTPTGLREAVKRAVEWAEATSGKTVFDFSKIAMPHPVGEYRSKVEKPWSEVPLADRMDAVLSRHKEMKIDDTLK